MKPYVSPEARLGLPECGDHDVSTAAYDIRNRLRAPFEASGQYKPRDGFVNVSAREVFKTAGCKIVRPMEIPPDVRKLILRAMREDDNGWHWGLPNSYETVLAGDAEPTEDIFDDHGWPSGYEIAATNDWSTIYFFHDLTERNPHGDVAWSIFRQRGDRYAIRNFNHDSYTGDIVDAVAQYLAIDEVAKTRAAVRGVAEGPSATA